MIVELRILCQYRNLRLTRLITLIPLNFLAFRDIKNLHS